MKTHSSNTFEVIRLLEEIVDRFTDEYRRPKDQIALYEKYVQLRQPHNAKLVRHLIVIPGGRRSKSPAPKDQPAEKTRALGDVNPTIRDLTATKQLP